LHRLQNFYRSSTQWVASLLPLAFVAIMIFVLYSILKAATPDKEENPQDA
jgi:sensor domain CHASE-containing protein